MTTAIPPSDTTNTKSPLEIAQRIVSELTGMSAENQGLAVRFAVETLRIDLGAYHSPARTVAAVHTNPNHTGRAIDIKSFKAKKDPKSDQQFTALVAYYFKFEAEPSERKDAIDPDTMKAAARLAGWPQVKRWGMTLTNAKNAGYLDPAGEGRFKISAVGENLVAITMPSAEAATRRKAKKAIPAKKRG